MLLNQFTSDGCCCTAVVDNLAVVGTFDVPAADAVEVFDGFADVIANSLQPQAVAAFGDVSGVSDSQVAVPNA